MDELEECIHLLDPATCSICKPKPAGPTFRRGRDGGAVATYYGTCSSCTNTIYPGDPIKGEPGQWKHESCQ